MTVIFCCSLVVSRCLLSLLPPVSSTSMPFLPSLLPSAIPPHTSYFSRLHTVLSPFPTLSTLSFHHPHSLFVSPFSPATLYPYVPLTFVITLRHQTPHRRLSCHLFIHPPRSPN